MGEEGVFFYFYRNIYTKIFHDYFIELKKAIEGCKSILDVGCGKTSLVRYLPKTIHSEGVEAFEPYLEESKRLGIHNKYHNLDVLEIDEHFKKKSFDCVLAGDVIEHLEKEDGFKLIGMMEHIARKKVIIYTPNGFLPIGERDGNNLYIHRSGWEVEEMRQLGFEVIGTSGWKVLRGDDAGIRFRPKFFWRVVSDVTQLYTRNHPEYAKQILCVKKVG